MKEMTRKGDKECKIFQEREILNIFFFFCVDYCKDSTDDDYSDSDSSKTTGYAVMDVVEYEVPSSIDDDDTQSSISSGTDVSGEHKKVFSCDHADQRHK
jgi:hypothetical protein